MLGPAQNIRYEQRTVSFNATTSLFNYGSLNTAYTSNTPQTWLALIRPTGAGEGNFGYIASKVSSATATGMRWMVDHNTGSPRIIFGQASGNTGPSQTAPAGSITYGRWVWVAATYAGGIGAANIRLYQGLPHVTEIRNATALDGTGSVDSTNSYNFVIGNRDGGDRTFAGDIACVVRWDAVLDQSEINTAIRLGPLSVRRKSILLFWAGGNDVSPHKLRTSTVTARALGGRQYKYPIERVIAPTWFAEAAGGGAQSIAPTGIDSLEAFGAHTISAGAVSVAPSAIDSLEAFGSATVTQGGVSIQCTGIATAEAFGSHTVSPGAVTITCSGIATGEAFGDPVVSAGGSLVVPSGIASAEAFGSHTLTPGAVSITCSGIASAEAFGSAVVQAGGQFISAAAINSLEAFGSHTITPGAVTITCSGIASAEAFGIGVVSGGAVTQLDSNVILVLSSENRLFMPSDNRLYRVQ